METAKKPSIKWSETVATCSCGWTSGDPAFTKSCAKNLVNEHLRDVHFDEWSRRLNRRDANRAARTDELIAKTQALLDSMRGN